MSSTSPSCNTAALNQLLAPHGLCFAELMTAAGLAKLDQLFLRHLTAQDAKLASRLKHYREAVADVATSSSQPTKQTGNLNAAQESEFLIACALQVQDFLAEVFGIQQPLTQHRLQLQALLPLFAFKQHFVARQLKKRWQSLRAKIIDEIQVAASQDVSVSTAQPVAAGATQDLVAERVAQQFNFQQLQQRLQERLQHWEQINPRQDWQQQLQLAAQVGVSALELRVATWGNALVAALKSSTSAAPDAGLQQQASQLNDDKELLLDWVLAAQHTTAGRALTADWVSLQLAAAQDFNALVPYQAVAEVGQDAAQVLQSPSTLQAPREGFNLVEHYLSLAQQQAQAHYCILCHSNQGDFCSRGFPQKKSQAELGLRQNPLQTTLTGCPLEQRISEMHALQRDGHSLAALAMIMRDNPLCPATGQRICNDCMQACIYQKQEPVDIPQTETGILLQILAMPWGVEIYHLLTMWNPLRAQQWCLAPANGQRVMVMGLGPAGFSLAHHLTMAGCSVTAADGLLIERLDPAYIQAPVRDFSSLQHPLSERNVGGFGGVAEYGITARWDKNFLSLLQMNLCRRQQFQILDAVRFGGQLTIERVWELGFDHLTIAVGAGLPRELPIAHSLAPGMRAANDFLMTLHLNAAYQFRRLVNLQVQLPAIVIGGGLTAIDAATELQAYYLRQVEDVAKRYELLQQQHGAASWQDLLQQQLSAAAAAKLQLMLEHAQAIEHERAEAKHAGRAVNFIPLLRAWGGVSIVYRRGLIDSPAYRTNHQELAAALAQGVIYREGLQPVAVVPDAEGHCQALHCQVRVRDEHGNWVVSDQHIELAACCILVATGAQPNVAYEYEHRGSLQRLGLSYQRYCMDGKPYVVSDNAATEHCKQAQVAPFSSYEKDGHRVSFIGDTHPLFHGSVVKAMASAKRSYPLILGQLASLKSQANSESQAGSDASLSASSLGDAQYTELAQRFAAEIVSLERLNASTLELVVRAPQAAALFRPGVFYRLQNYAADAPCIADTLLQCTPLALLATAVAGKADCLSFIVLEDSVAQRMVASWQVGQPLAVMGPAGVGSSKSLRELQGDLLLVGDALAAIYLLAHAELWRPKSALVQVILEFDSVAEVFAVPALQSACHAIVWCFKQPVAPAPAAVTRQCQKLLALRATDAVFYGTAADYMQLQANNAPKADGKAWMYSDIRQVVALGDHNLLCILKALRAQALWSAETSITAAAYGPMQCMLKGVCAQCLQWQIDPATGKRSKAVYACSWQHQPLALLDLTHLAQRQLQADVLEPLHQLWLDYILEEHKPAHWV